MTTKTKTYNCTFCEDTKDYKGLLSSHKSHETKAIITRIAFGRPEGPNYLNTPCKHCTGEPIPVAKRESTPRTEFDFEVIDSTPKYSFVPIKRIIKKRKFVDKRSVSIYKYAIRVSMGLIPEGTENLRLHVDFKKKILMLEFTAEEGDDILVPSAKKEKSNSRLYPAHQFMENLNIGRMNNLKPLGKYQGNTIISFEREEK